MSLDLHIRASQWYAKAGLVNNAMFHAFESQDMNAALKVLDE